MGLFAVSFSLRPKSGRSSPAERSPLPRPTLEAQSDDGVVGILAGLATNTPMVDLWQWGCSRHDLQNQQDFLSCQALIGGHASSRYGKFPALGHSSGGEREGDRKKTAPKTNWRISTNQRTQQKGQEAPALSSNTGRILSHRTALTPSPKKVSLHLCLKTSLDNCNNWAQFL